MELFNHQKKFLEKNVERSLLCWDTGTGKTTGSIMWANIKEGPVLVICPKALKENWSRTLKEHAKFTYDVVSKEEFRKYWEDLVSYKTIIVDEAHYFAGMKSAMSKGLGKFIKRFGINNVLLLTATPYLSTPWNIYTLASFLGHKWSYMSFKDKFFDDRYIGRRVVAQVKEGIEDEIASLVARIGDIVKIEECADIPEQVFETESFELTDAQKKRKDKVMELSPIVRFTKYHQIENGSLKGDGYTENEFIENYKIDRIIDLCNVNKKVIIVCRYNLQIDYIHNMLRKEFKDRSINIIRGDVKNRDVIVRQAEESNDCIMLINAACSEGYELPSFPLMVFASLDFSYKNYKQMIGRILRINKLKKNVYIHLVTEGIDKDIYDSIIRKQSFDLAIYLREKGIECSDKYLTEDKEWLI